MRTLLFALALAACGAPSTPMPAPASTPVPSPPEAPAPEPAPSPLDAEALDAEALDGEALSRHRYDLVRYPPTRCRLEHLLGADFDKLTQRGGAYPSDDEESDGGIAYFGAACPQPLCPSAMVWVRADGAVVVALYDDRLDLFTNRPALVESLPSAVERYLKDIEAQTPVERHWRVRSLGDDPRCASSAIAKRAERFEAVKAQRGCDAELSSFWAPARVVPERAFFHSAATSQAKGGDQVAGSAMVQLGDAHADAKGFRCAEHRALDGRRTVGWLRAEDVAELDHVDAPTLDVAKNLVRDAGPTPTWLAAGAPARALGDLTIERLAGSRVQVKLESVQAGHLCTVEGEMTLVAPRVLDDAGTGCGARALLFDNGLHLWENGSCSGARATCTGGYFAARPR